MGLRTVAWGQASCQQQSDVRHQPRPLALGLCDTRASKQAGARIERESEWTCRRAGVRPRGWALCTRSAVVSCVPSAPTARLHDELGPRHCRHPNRRHDAASWATRHAAPRHRSTARRAAPRRAAPRRATCLFDGFGAFARADHLVDVAAHRLPQPERGGNEDLTVVQTWGKPLSKGLGGILSARM